MIKLKSLLKEDAILSSEVKSLENSIKSKYAQYLEQFHIYYDEKSNSLFLTDIYIKAQFKGRGWGGKIMKDITDFSDSKKLVVQTIPVAESIRPNAMRRLVNFYKRFGFIENNGNALYDDMGMYRLPK
jgi:GNAT superfamily N-acetyltransferase